MEKEYPTIDGLKAVLKVLKSLEYEPSYLQQELIRAELQTYRTKVLKEMFNIDKDPVPVYAAEVTEEKTNEKGIFIFFIDPLQFVEIVDENGNPEENLEQFIAFKLTGIYISKSNPERVQISLAPKEALLDLLQANKKMKEKPIIIDEEIGTENHDQKRNIDFN